MGKKKIALHSAWFVVISPEGIRLWWTRSDTEAGAIQNYNKDGNFQDNERWGIAELKGYKVKRVRENITPEQKGGKGNGTGFHQL